MFKRKYMSQYRELLAEDEGKGILIERDAGVICYNEDRTLVTERAELIKEVGYKKMNFDYSKPLYYYAILQKKDTLNRNGRVYPGNVLDKEVARYDEQVVKKGSAIGELDHPESTVISLKHGPPIRIVEVLWEGPTLLGKVEILVSRGFRESGICSTDADYLALMLEYGCVIGLSSRGVGSVKKSGNKKIVQEDFELICWDVVSTPSTPGAYLFPNLEDKNKYDETLVTKEVSSYNTQTNNNTGSQAAFAEFLNKFKKR